jgi:hypothetical protein
MTVIGVAQIYIICGLAYSGYQISKQGLKKTVEDCNQRWLRRRRNNWFPLPPRAESLAMAVFTSLIIIGLPLLRTLLWPVEVVDIYLKRRGAR